MTDPFAPPATDFITAKDMVGRLALITPTGVETGIQSTMPNAKEGDTYDRVICDVVLLDGQITDKFTEVPFRMDGTILSGSGLVPQLTRRVGGGKLEPGRMTLGRFTTRKGKYPTPAVVLAEPTDEDKNCARAYLATLDPFA